MRISPTAPASRSPSWHHETNSATVSSSFTAGMRIVTSGEPTSSEGSKSRTSASPPDRPSPLLTLGPGARAPFTRRLSPTAGLLSRSDNSGPRGDQRCPIGQNRSNVTDCRYFGRGHSVVTKETRAQEACDRIAGLALQQAPWLLGLPSRSLEGRSPGACGRRPGGRQAVIVSLAEARPALARTDTERFAQRNWPAVTFGSLSHTTATTSPGSITTHPVSRSRRTRPSARTSTPVSFSFSVATNPMWPALRTSKETDPDLPMRDSSRSRIVSPVIDYHLQISPPAGCPEAWPPRTGS